MATVNLDLTWDSNQIGNNLIIRDKIREFEQKWSQDVKMFEGELFVEDKEGNIYLLVRPGLELNISTKDYDNLKDLPNKSRAVYRLFSNVIEESGDTDFKFEEYGFESEFYKDLFNLYKIENEDAVLSLSATVTVMSGTGYYSGHYEFLEEGGIKASFTYYDDDEDVYEDD